MSNQLPRGEPLSEALWGRRHRGFVIFLWLQAFGLALFGVAQGFGPVHSFLEASVVALSALCASVSTFSRRLRAVAVTFGLLSASAILVHLSGGMIEAHFHFFVMVTLITLYQDWVPFLLSIAYVVLHHGIVGTLDPESVFNHPAAFASPVEWAALHGAFIVAASVAGLIVWRRNEELAEHLARDERAVGRQRASLTIASANDAFITIDKTSMVLDWNKASERIFGWSQQEAIGRFMPELIMPERFRAAHLAGIEKLRATGEGPVLYQTLELAALRRDGTEIAIDITIWPVEVDGDLQFNAFVRDISDRKQAEQYKAELEQAALRRKQALELNDTIVQGLAAANLALGLDDAPRASALVKRTLATSQRIVSGLLSDADTGRDGLGAGDLIRSSPALSMPRDASDDVSSG
ncbi:MAG TPA: PAS domain S-box protein [Actinomycetota bacterium]|nr:PAS domain S-box protein [Actinomycetota bacterium]